MKLYLTLACLVAALFPLTPLRVGAVRPETELAGRTISMELVKAEDLSPANWPGETLTLTTQVVVTKADDNIFKLLKSGGIYPDAEAYTLLYDLNPGLEKLAPLAPNLTVKYPKVVGDAEFQQMLKNGYLVMLTVDSKEKRQLRIDTDAIKELSARLEQLEPRRFADSAKRLETINFIRDSANWFEAINITTAQRKAPPLRKVTLVQIAHEAEVLRAILEQAVTYNKKLSVKDQTQISAVHQDLDQLLKNWDQTMALDLPPAEPQFDVVVEIKGNDVKKIQTLRVYYVMAGLFRDPPKNPPVRSTNFNGLGSGSSATLPIHNYKIWAAKDGDPEHPATPIALLPVRKPLSGNTIKLELSLK